ncbi:MAG: hypothetical protein K2L38_01570 [Dysosmobacter sp.]|nr:hypothetical protein [Dysosmobacter sp.]
MKNRYQKLTEAIHTPAGLNDRVLFEARRRAAEAERAAVSRRGRRNWGRSFLRTAACAACALALVLGGFSLRPAPTAGHGASGPAGSAAPGAEQGSPAQVLVPTFGLTAYAAMTERAYGPAEDGSLAFAIGEGCTTMEFGDFTGCLFQITGENIVQVKMSIDRGGLYRYQSRENLTEEQMAEYRQAMADGSLAPAAISQRDNGTWYMPEMTALGQSVQEDYDPEACYGFWVPPEDMAVNTGLGITTEAQMDADYFDGGLLTVTVVSSDGTEKSQTYRLHSGALKIEFEEDNSITVLPELASPEEQEKNSFIYGIYAAPED